MKLLFHIPPVLRGLADGQASVLLEGTPATVADALALLFVAQPGLRDRVLDERGAVRLHVNVFVGDEPIRFTGGLATPLRNEALAVAISIVPAVSGGVGVPAWA